jgi:hypothetical protein
MVARMKFNARDYGVLAYHPSATDGACSKVLSRAMRPFSPRLALTRSSTAWSSGLVKFVGSGTYVRRMVAD